VTQPAGPQMLVVGRDVDGSWTVKESAGELLGRFATNVAAASFAERQRKGRPATAIASSAGQRPRLQGRLTLSSGRGSRPDDQDA
jgi:hypothetical protein